MCGITGIYCFHKNAAANIACIYDSNEKHILRGPDSGHVFTDEQVGLGHRRLSIIDTSAAANQPMQDCSGRYVLVFNGEIFNFQELAQKHLTAMLPQLGKKQFSSDTEVLLYLLIAHGAQCLRWLDGFFAFFLYDRTTGKALMARDRYGKKPLLFYQDKDFFAFASEMKALLAYPIPRELDYTVLHQYLQLNYVPQPQSMLKGIQKMKPGHYMELSRKGIVSVQPFYELKCRPECYRRYSYEQAQNILIEKIDTAVQERMIADVPLGAFLSGGIDSSVIVALASRYTRQLHTFSVGYKDNPFFDETRYAQAVAQKYHTDHTVFSLTNADFLQHLTDVLDYIDEPFADSSALPVYILSQRTRQHVTVALSGDGGDEIFAGYNKHAAEWRVRQHSLLNTLIKAGKPLWQLLPQSRNHKLTNTFRQLYRFAAGAQLPVAERYWRWAALATPAQVNALLLPESLAAVSFSDLASEKAALLQAIRTDDYNEILVTDMNLVLLSDMLVKVDLMSMANSLEIRSPLLDHKVVDFAFGLPADYKIDGQMKKKILQDAFRSLLPEEIYNRPKHGFEIPLLGWFRNELWSLINDDLLSNRFIAEQKIFNPAATERLKQKMRSNNPEDSHATIWALLVFQHWWKKYLG
jgi:asparagine synthase (glutamine-hydrolysing)